MSRMVHTRVELREANAFVAQLHRHHRPVIGHKFSLGAVKDGEIVGVVIVGRPVARMRDDGRTLEVTRLCTDGTPNACSFLYGAAAKAAFALGYERIGTYTLASEGGSSLRASGWKLLGERGGGSWSRPSRSREDKHPTEPKLLWESVVKTCSCETDAFSDQESAHETRRQGHVGAERHGDRRGDGRIRHALIEVVARTGCQRRPEGNNHRELRHAGNLGAGTSPENCNRAEVLQWIG